MKKIAVLIPCYNESKTIQKVVADYRTALPEADIYVYDNNSSDGTDVLAREAGAIVRYEHRQGKGNVIRDGKDAVIFTCGIMVEQCLETVEILKEKGMDVALVNLHTIKPIDSALIRTYAAKCHKVFTVEEHSVIGGLGDAVAAELVGSGTFTFKKIGIQDTFGQSGKPADLLREYKLNGALIAEQILEAK